MDQRLELSTRLTQRLSQQQLRFVRLLELNAAEMDEAVEQELEENPALEAIRTAQPDDRPQDDAPSPYYSFMTRRDREADAPAFSPADQSESLADILSRQIAERHVPPSTARIADYIIGNLDSNGWLTRPLPRMIDDLAINGGIHVDEEEARQALDLVRSLEPAGVGGENLADTLLLQLHRLPESQQRDDAIAILTGFFKEYHMRHSHKIISGLGISEKRLQAANELILSLNPKPGAPYGGNESTAAAMVMPDFAVSDYDGQLTIRVVNRIPELTIEESFSEAMRGLEHRRRQQRKGSEFIVSNFNNARDFIRLVSRRQQTLMSVMTAIVDWQKDYFLTGDIAELRPMSLKDISAISGQDISVVSRATNNKYVQMPWGEVAPLKSLFSGQVNAPAPGHAKEEKGDADTLTNRQIQNAIAELISTEDTRHPLSDEKLRSVLCAQGYDISRRTIAKYRDRAGIPVARLRKKI